MVTPCTIILGRWADDERNAEDGIGALRGLWPYDPGPGVSSPMMLSQSPGERGAIPPNEPAPVRVERAAAAYPSITPSSELFAAKRLVVGLYAPGSPVFSTREDFMEVDLKGGEAFFASGFCRAVSYTHLTLPTKA